MFDDKSKEDWLNQVQKELKGKLDISELNFKIDEFEVSPFHHIDEVQDLSPIYRSQNTMIGIYSTDNPINSNLIEKYLALGASAIKLDLHPEYMPQMEGIFFDLVQTHIYGNSNDAEKFIGEYSIPESNYVVIDNAKNYHIIKLNFENSFSDEVFESIEINDDQVNNRKLYFEISLSNNFYKNIAGLRALRIIIANLSKYINQDIDYLLCVSLSSLADANEKETGLISYTYQSMAAFMGGADFIFQEISDEDIDRTAYHIQNLLTLESRLNAIQDPVAGSKFFESLTNQFVLQVWDKLVS